MILTQNRYIAKYLLHKHNCILSKKFKAWITPKICYIETWLNELWLSCSAYKPVLSEHHQQLLFEQIIKNSDQGENVIDINLTAKNVVDAWDYIQKWQIPLNTLKMYTKDSIDTSVFYYWITIYSDWLIQHNMIDIHILANSIFENIKELAPNLPNTICLYGMQNLAPIYKKIFHALTKFGINIIEDKLFTPSTKISRIGFANQDQELKAAASLAAASSNKKKSIGIVIPNLAAQRQNVLHTFLEYIYMEELNISVPLNLSNYNLIDTALLILQQAKPILDYADISFLLRTPYISYGHYSASQLAKIDSILRKKNTAQILINKKLNNDRHNSEYWIQLMQTILIQWGWPGKNKFTSEESDLLNHWENLLNEYYTLDLIIGKHTYIQALKYIDRLSNLIKFIPTDTKFTHVHILCISEAEGIPFDKLWVMGMTKRNWPIEPNPNIFIPIELQYFYNLPHHNAYYELTFAKNFINNMHYGGIEEVIFSYPLSMDDNTCIVSNLITDLPEINSYKIKQSSIKYHILQEFHDDIPSTLTKSYISSGTKFIKLQSQCPFKAYSEIRLDASPLIQPNIFLTAAQRGTIIHEILEFYWLENGQLNIKEIISHVLNLWHNAFPYIFNVHSYKLEFLYLSSLLENWVKYEKNRKPFTVIALEKSYSVQISNIIFNIKVDRIDLLDDGTKLVIDYKTGSIPSFDPQLAIYKHYIAPKAAYYHIKPNQIKLQEYIYSLDIKNLADQFIAGDAKVYPISPQICNNCQLHSLCRIYDN